MSIKVIIDNNFFDKYNSYTDDKTKNLIENAFKNKRISLYITTELISELIGLYDTQRRDFLREYSKFLLVSGYRILNAWNEIIKLEIGINQSGSMFVDSSMAKNIKEFLEDIAQDKKPTEIDHLLDWIQMEKESNYGVNKEAQTRGVEFKKFKERISFEEFYRLGPVIQFRKNLIRDIYNRSGRIISDENVDHIINDAQKYPYLQTYLRLELNLHYHHVLLQQRVDVGDEYDIRQLLYLINLDYFLSQEKRLKIFSSEVFGINKVINFDELVGIIEKS